MNIFVLDADQHVVKTILEATQMLCTVLHQRGMDAPYKPTHLHHPCTIWTGESLANWRWLRRLTHHLNREFRYRYGNTTDHKSAVVARGLPVPPIANLGLTEFAQAMPEEYRLPGDPVQAYREFYVGEKARFATWTRRKPPKWFAIIRHG